MRKWKSMKETVARKARSPLKDAGFLLRVFPRERHYAELGYLLPFYLRLAVKTRCIGPSSWHAIYIYPITVRTFGHAPVGLWTAKVLAELHRRDVLGTRAFRASSFRVGDLLAFMQVVEAATLDAR